MTTTPAAVTHDPLTRIRAVLAAAPDADTLQPIGLREVVTGAGAATAVGNLLRRLGVPAGTVVVLSDATPKAARPAAPTRPGGSPQIEDAEDADDAVDVVTATLTGDHTPRRVVLHPSTGQATVHADEDTVGWAVDAVRAVAPSGLVTVGSGTMADIGKVVADRLDLVHVVVQTAASVNGFTDNQSVLLINGAKRTTPSRWPTGLIIDCRIVAAAPPAMTRSGLGDQLSMFTAAADWYLAGAVGFDPSYSPTLVRFMREGFADLAAAAEDLGRGEPDAVILLADALARGGLAMGAAGRTSPSSGAEHTISHLLEMHADAHGRPSAMHGEQVGVASVVAAAVWRRVRAHLSGGGVTVGTLDEQAMHERVRSAFGPLDAAGAIAQECWTAYRRKLTWMTTHRDQIQQVCDTWARHDLAVTELLAEPRVLADTLHRAGAANRFADLGLAPDPATVSWAIANNHLMRDRFTVVDLAELIGLWTPDDVQAVLDQTQETPPWR